LTPGSYRHQIVRVIKQRTRRPVLRKLFASKLFSFGVVLGLGAPAFAAPLLDRPGLVSTDWLAERIEDPGLRIIDARASLRAYVQGHVPGAVYLNTETVRISEGGVPARLLAPEQIAEILGKLGIANDHTVVVYSSAEESFAHAAYVAFLLEWLGQRAIGVLDGGIEKWRAEDRELSRKFPVRDPVAFQARPEASVIETADEVRRAIAGRQTVLLDAREPPPFAAGHLPTARNLFHGRGLTESEIKTWRSPDELRALASAVGADGGQPVITYCTSGRESAQLWFTLRHVAGLPRVSSYHGSWIDWTVRGLPTGSGPGARTGEGAGAPELPPPPAVPETNAEADPSGPAAGHRIEQPPASAPNVVPRRTRSN
jgi:thiosulfate/3-mercaptopyruvate sulfurtransferase